MGKLSVEEIVVRILPKLEDRLEKCYQEMENIEDKVSIQLTGRKLMGVVRHQQIDDILNIAYKDIDHILANLESRILTSIKASLIYSLAEQLIENKKFRESAPPELVKETEQLVRGRKIGTLLAYSDPLLAITGRIYGYSSSVVPDREKRWGRKKKSEKQANNNGAGLLPAPGNG